MIVPRKIGRLYLQRVVPNLDVHHVPSIALWANVVCLLVFYDSTAAQTLQNPCIKQASCNCADNESMYMITTHIRVLGDGGEHGLQDAQLSC